MTTAVRAEQRFTRRHPCPICGGHKDQPKGIGKRCYGFLSEDGGWAHCTRSEYAGALFLNEESGTYTHRLTSDCMCGQCHDGAPTASNGHDRQPIPPPRITTTY